MNASAATTQFMIPATVTTADEAARLFRAYVKPRLPMAREFSDVAAAIADAHGHAFRVIRDMGTVTVDEARAMLRTRIA